MDMLNAVNQWIATANDLLGKQPQIPLIDDSDFEMPDHGRALAFGDDSLREAFHNVLSRDPHDLAARFVALTAYYRLSNTVQVRMSQFGTNWQNTDAIGEC